MTEKVATTLEGIFEISFKAEYHITMWISTIIPKNKSEIYV